MKNLFNCSPAFTLLSAKAWQLGAKMALLLPVFLWLHACSQTPTPSGNTPAAGKTSLLTDTTNAAVLGNSFNNAYRLFKSTRQDGDQSVTDLVLLRLQDMKETLVSTVPTEVQAPLPNPPKFFWSQDSKYLMVENRLADSTGTTREVVLFDLATLSIIQRHPGALVAFDQINEMVIYYRSDVERQSICYFNLRKPEVEKVRDIIAPPTGKLPAIIFVYKEKKARVKAYTTDDAPVNIILEY